MSANENATDEAVDILPSAQRLTTSLRDIGYDFVTAVADIVDNSVSAGASRVDVRIEFAGRASRVVISDDGVGMTASSLNEALRFGSSREYKGDDLGRFGLGLKTASLSQCRRLLVLSRAAARRRRIESRALDLDWMHQSDRWAVLVPAASELPAEYVEPLHAGPGTVVVWEALDRVMSYADPDGHWARRRIEALADNTFQYLAMVFHRFLAGELEGRAPLKITINGETVQPWEPFASEEPSTQTLTQRSFTIEAGEAVGRVHFRPFVLPPRERFSSFASFDRLAGPNKWNRQQGLYFYRAGRLIQHGGWSGMRTIDEHTKLARAAVEFDPCLDELFQVNVAKMRVSLPAQVRALIEKPVAEMCLVADRTYREAGTVVSTSDESEPAGDEQPNRAPASSIGFALRAAAMELGETEPLERILSVIRERAPHLAQGLGWSD